MPTLTDDSDHHQNTVALIRMLIGTLEKAEFFFRMLDHTVEQHETVEGAREMLREAIEEAYEGVDLMEGEGKEVVAALLPPRRQARVRRRRGGA
jgi:hypothetical protein